MANQGKRNAGRAAADLAVSGQVLGLGTGSTAAFFLERLAERMREEGLRVRGIPTSKASERQARELGIPLATFAETTRIDLAVDGADEVDPGFHLVKGGGGALLREKVVASRAAEVVIVVDAGKRVRRLADRFPLPVEVAPFALECVLEELVALGARPAHRRAGGEPYVTDNGLWIVDARFPGGIDEPELMERAIDQIPGVAESGLFVNLCDRLVVGSKDGVEVLVAPAPRTRRRPGPGSAR
jgi:ribose 5-phosphate isomerase A